MDSGPRRARSPRCRCARVDAVARRTDAAVAGGDGARGGPEHHRRARGDRGAAAAARGSHRHASARRTTGAEHRRASRRLSRGDLDAAPPRAAVVRGRDRVVRLRARRRRTTPGGRAPPGWPRAQRTRHRRAARPRPVAKGAGSAGARPGRDRRRRPAQRGRPVAAHRRRRGSRRRPHRPPSQPVVRPGRAGQRRPHAGAAARARAGSRGGGPLRSSRAVATAQPACPDRPGCRCQRHRSRGRGGRDCRRWRRAAAAREGAGARVDQARRPHRAAAPAGRDRRERAGVRRPPDRRSRISA